MWKWPKLLTDDFLLEKTYKIDKKFFSSLTYDSYYNFDQIFLESGLYIVHVDDK